MEEFEVTIADMLEIVAGGGNGVEYVDIVGLMEKAAKELREKYAEIERLREALHKLASDDYECWCSLCMAGTIARAALGKEK